MNKEEAINILNMWNKAEEIVINDEKEFDKKPYIQRKQAIETILKHIDDSISKEVIEEKIEKYKQQLKNNTKRVVQLQVLEQNKSLQQSEWEELNMLFGDIEKIRGKIVALEELLKKN